MITLRFNYKIKTINEKDHYHIIASWHTNFTHPSGIIKIFSGIFVLFLVSLITEFPKVQSTLSIK